LRGISSSILGRSGRKPRLLGVRELVAVVVVVVTIIIIKMITMTMMFIAITVC
jgi:hypothetical protein